MENLKMSSDMSFDEVFLLLENWGNESRRKISAKKNAGDNQFGVAIGNLRMLAKKLNTNHSLAMKLWETENTDARILSTMIMDKEELSLKEISDIIDSITYFMLTDEFIYNVVVKTDYANEIYIDLINLEDEYKGRAGWNIVISKVLNKESLDIDNIIEKIEKEIKNAPIYKQQSMNRCLCEIGINFSEYTQKCIDIGERIGKLDNRQVPKGCTSTYAPEWINAVINRRDRVKINKSNT